MRRLKVGIPLHPEATGFEEGVHYNYTPGGHTLTLSMKEPRTSEIAEVQLGQPAFAVGTVDEVLFLLAKFGDSPWRVAHYSWWLNPPVMRPDPLADIRALKAGISLSLCVCLVNASNGFVKALRAVKFTREFSLSLLRRVEIQTRHRFDPWHYLHVVEKMKGDYPDGSNMIHDGLCVCSADLKPMHSVTARPSFLWQ